MKGHQCPHLADPDHVSYDREDPDHDRGEWYVTLRCHYCGARGRVAFNPTFATWEPSENLLDCQEYDTLDALIEAACKRRDELARKLGRS